MTDLVQRLRDYPSYEESLQAADRIEALEKRMWEMHGEAHEYIKRLKALEDEYNGDQETIARADTHTVMLMDRIEALETALRGIAESSVRPGTAAFELQQIAARALEIKND